MATTEAHQERVQEEVALVSAGQRRINAIWETTQAVIALTSVGSILFVSSRLALLASRGEVSERQSSISVTAFMLLSNLGSLIIGFYFGRTNHTRQGGVGAAKSIEER